MKKTIVLRTVIHPQKTVVLDTEQGKFAIHAVEDQVAKGNYAVVNGDEFSVFSMDKQLYFQWNTKRWNFRGLGDKVEYRHDFQNGITIFSIEDTMIEYPAWWVGDPIFDPNLPERDEEEDFLGYVAYLAGDGNLQQRLIQSWDCNSKEE
ncbi:hypothetical protein IGB42_02340 [Andreprevotia sp. IGB-42]|uniref:hypothetical protein n=1 Tax=Andreprevotia sp. IGB-42 TaxID=2497473 RepID=UPI00135A3704|nr:hypothetical protein [Andreprevotia sp. IGB-42]KAF0813411.1 hypothetical protein IGB42_02340 [Andreprevotia sp. IGB-42]